MKRGIALALVLAPAIALLALLGWGLANAQNKSFAGFAVNASFGDAPVTNPTPANFTLQLLDGGSASLQGLRGRPAMIDFWSSWCAPCQQEAPELARVARDYRDSNLSFLGIALWDADQDVRRFLERNGIRYPNGIDQRGAIAIDFGVTGIPEKYLVDANGTVVRKFVGPVPEDMLREALDALIAGR